jgi:uncharacterized protein (DUF1778 family)
MMKPLNMSIRFGGSERELLKRAADTSGENMTEFVKNSILLRIQNKQLQVKPLDLAQVMDQLLVTPYHPSQVSKKDAAQIKDLLEADRAGKLDFKAMGRVAVQRPKRKSDGSLK